MRTQLLRTAALAVVILAAGTLGPAERLHAQPGKPASLPSQANACMAVAKARDRAPGRSADRARAHPLCPNTILTLLHTNDTHARLEEVPASGSDPAHGGVARLKTLVNQVREEVGKDRVLLVDAGDYSQGTIFWSAWKGSDAVMFLNDIGYDVVTLGNHEFNLGPDNLVGRILGEPVNIASVDYPTEPLQAPMVVTNLDLSGEPALDALVAPSVIVQKGGVRYGVLGLVTDTTRNISSPGPNIVFLDYVESVQAEVDRLRQQEGIRHIILLSHVNFYDDLELAAQLSGVDIIVSGHDHVLLGDPARLPAWTHSRIQGEYPAAVTNLDGETTLVVSAWEWTRALGRLDVEFDVLGRIVSWSGGPIIAEASVPEDPYLKMKVAEYRAPVDAFANETIGSAGVAFSGARGDENPPTPGLRSQEMPLGNLVAATMLNYPQLAGLGIQAAITNGGGIRASIDTGSVTFGQALSVLPFGNTLFAMDVSGVELVAALDNGLSWALSDTGMAVRSTGAFPQVAGMTVRYCGATLADIQTRQLPPTPCDGALRPGGLVTSVEIQGAPVALDQTYRIVTNNFMARGGDFYTSLRQACERPASFCEDTFFLMLDAFVDEFQRNSPVVRSIEGRLAAD
jgi:2',3'-cyclic-nucleotide 2'-phosphodiesterase (5'-nucleotidase family)